MVAPSKSDGQTLLALALVYYQSVGGICLFACQHYRVVSSAELLLVVEKWPKEKSTYLIDSAWSDVLA
ncbi:MAG: hypothetical protein COW76_20135 [Shewanella sp. CG18_big_fil_WC_8_21_14_2_50_42_11]|nr:MAG: hypothetical protein COW76_20135 [Shewanella sp. CG18_big_fil_WC_8_21_14_2_50_42_11]PIX70531.1 MAG: hypothetical protein COZ42_14230 [Shewanella sp. CG_4_10_14_3_um_filter_42_91]PIY67554.1 MAG: hypothetical protein COY92_04890 [Shewanella sp. CG_4_10_14_0_8_um_filter_42_13]PJB90047.1 MAG: hypothetical protein CO084_18265 [Shewanella sp. CG_4_9_14_0_8_um_filter_42_14]